MDYDGLGERITGQLEEDQVDELSEILLNTQEQCQMVDRLIRDQIQVKDALIDKLHAELDFYKKESANRFVDQVMKAVIKVRKDMARRINSSEWSDMSSEDLSREYIYVYEDLTDLLEQQNIDAYVSNAGEPFDAAIHQAKIEYTDDPQLDKLVKSSMNEGYKKGEKVLIPERVVVYQYKTEDKGDK